MFKPITPEEEIAERIRQEQILVDVREKLALEYATGLHDDPEYDSDED